MKAYKINLEPYDSEMSVKKEDGEMEIKKRTMHAKFDLPRQLCNPLLGSSPDGKGQERPHQKFNLMEIGPIAQRIEQCREPYVIVSKEEFEVLKNRVLVISKYFGYPNYEMFKRVVEAQETILEEPKK